MSLLCSTLSSCQTIFDSDVWKVYDWENSSLDSPRMKMIDDVMENYIKIGMTKSDIVDILGKPDGANDRSELIEGRVKPDTLTYNYMSSQPKAEQEKLYASLSKWYSENSRTFPALTYGLGPTLGDYMFLIIEFNDKGLVVNYWTEQS